MSRYLDNLIAEGENQHLDFKFEISDAKKIARTFSAFANTGGGKLLIGVKDNGVISGIRTDEEAYMAESAAHLYCKPKVNYEIVTHQVLDKTVLEIIIPESTDKPHLAPWRDNTWKAFVRSEDENFVASPVIVQVWEIKNKKKSMLVKYDDYEQKLFAFLKTQDEITLKEYMRHCKIRYHIAKKILANLVSIDIIGYRVTDTETYFYLIS